MKGICEQVLSRRSEGVEEGNIRQDGRINIREKKFEKSTKYKPNQTLLLNICWHFKEILINLAPLHGVSIFVVVNKHLNYLFLAQLLIILVHMIVIKTCCFKKLFKTNAKSLRSTAPPPITPHPIKKWGFQLYWMRDNLQISANLFTFTKESKRKLDFLCSGCTDFVNFILGHISNKNQNINIDIVLISQIS